MTLNPIIRVEMRTSRVMKGSGFSLIELLVVISIIAILAALLLPAIGLVRKSANQAGCMSNQRQVAMALIAYAGDAESALPYGVDPAGVPWNQAVMPYLDAGEAGLAVSRILKCPEDDRPWTTAVPPRSYVVPSYWTAGSPTYGWAGWPGNGDTRKSSLAFPEFAHPSATIMATEEWTLGGAYTGNFQNTSGWSVMGPYFFGNPVTPLPAGKSRSPWYHGQVIVYVFADGHAEALNPTKVSSEWLVR